MRGASIPLKVKDVCGAIDIDKLERLPMSTETANQLRQALDWIRPSPVYTKIASEMAKGLTRDKASNRLTEQDMAELRAVGKFAQFRTQDTQSTTSPTKNMVAKFGCNAFTVEEVKWKDGKLVWARRPIIEPLINDAVAELVRRGELEVTVAFKDKTSLRQDIASSEAAVQFDLVSCFDQIQLDKGIRHFFCVGDSSTDDPEVCTVLTMGYKGSVKVAEAFLGALTPYPLPPSVRTTTRVDNILFTGPSRDVETCRVQFEERCRLVGAVLNASEGIETKYEFLGESYAHGDEKRAYQARRCITEKTRWKLLEIRKVMAPGAAKPLEVRRVAAIFGLLFFAGETMRVLPARFHKAMRTLASIASACALQTLHWRSSVTLDEVVWSELDNWARSCLGEPVQLWSQWDNPDHKNHTMEVFVDASELGWGAVVLKEGRPMAISRPWSTQDWAQWNLASSVAAEPLAVERALLWVCPPLESGSVLLHTDHLPLVYAARAGYGRAWAYSRLLASLEKRLPSWKVIFSWIAGAANPADIWSRQRHWYHLPEHFVTAIGSPSTCSG